MRRPEHRSSVGLAWHSSTSAMYQSHQLLHMHISICRQISAALSSHTRHLWATTRSCGTFGSDNPTVALRSCSSHLSLSLVKFLAQTSRRHALQLELFHKTPRLLRRQGLQRLIGAAAALAGRPAARAARQQQGFLACRQQHCTQLLVLRVGLSRPKRANFCLARRRHSHRQLVSHDEPASHAGPHTLLYAEAASQARSPHDPP